MADHFFKPVNEELEGEEVGDLHQARSDVYPLGAALRGQIKQFCKKFPADAFGRRTMSFLNRPVVVATMAVRPLPPPAHPPFTEALKPLKHISIWMERPPRAALGGRPLCSGLCGLF